MVQESNEHLAIGYKIGGHYEIVKVLGQGGFGIVYLVKDIHRLDAYFVIKELFSRDFSFRHRDGKTVYNKAEAKQIFAKIKEDITSEVNILQKIRNKNIVEAYGFFEENNTLYSIMEFIDGVDLDKYLKKVPPFSEDEAKDLLLQIINGIKEIHALNILHRDMKPSNIMRTADGVYKIIDFTTNRTYVDNQMTTVTAFQSPIYTPPELSGNKRAIIGKFSDIYSIGMTICRVLAEDEETLPNITDRLIDDSEFQATIDNLDISSDFKSILIKMTEIDADDRFQDLEDIEKLISSNYSINIEDNIRVPQEEPRTPKKKDKIKKDNINKEDKDSTKSWFTTIAILLAVVFIALGGYAYKIVQDDKQKAKISKKDNEVSTYIPKHSPFKKQDEEVKEDEIKQEIKPLEIPEIEETPTPTPTETPIINDEEEIEDIEVVATPKPTIIVQTPTPISTHHNISLGTMIQAGKGANIPTNKSVFNRGNVQRFLLNLLNTSQRGSIDNLLFYYNYRVDRYFSLKNITHREIYRDRLRYNRKWVNREFRLISFDILYRYKKGGVEYCDIKKRISYKVVSSHSKVASGMSSVRMTLKNSPNGFKITSIYSIK